MLGTIVSTFSTSKRSTNRRIRSWEAIMIMKLVCLACGGTWGLNIIMEAWLSLM